MMTQHEKLLIVASIITCYLLQAQGADNYSDENRPYEFGFTIAGEQHRHEEKDKNGIIKGEYGFITADGVYHVTVYATDEQGRFKILSMKNIRYADYKGLTGAPVAKRQGHSLQLPSPRPAIPSEKPTPVVGVAPKPAQKLETISIEPPANSCSHCSIPTTSTAAPEVKIPPINTKNGASGFANVESPSNPLNVGNNQYTIPGNTPSVNLRNSFSAVPQQQYPERQENNFNEKQNSNRGIQGFGQEPKAPGKQNNDQTTKIIPQRPNQGIIAGPTNSFQDPYLPGLQNKPYDQQYKGVGPQINNIVSHIPNKSEKTFIESGPLSVHQEPNSLGPQSLFSGQQNAPGRQQPGGSQVTSGEQQITPSDQQYPKQGPQFDSDRVRSGKQYNEKPNLSTPQTSRTDGSGVLQAKSNPNQKPMLAYAQMQIVDKNTDIHAKQPGEKDGLPPGLKEDDMLQLLYTFNYTLGFQAHFEEGYTNGVKRGYYYTTGRNGVRTRIDYVADENGFRPTLSQEVFDLISDDVPKENTEKEEKYGLKGYEFKWLYFPVETSSH